MWFRFSVTRAARKSGALSAAFLLLAACQAIEEESVCDDLRRDIAKLEAKKQRTTGDDYVLAALIRERSNRNCE